MRIAHVTATFPPYRAGAGNVCFHNARLMAERGHDVTVYTARLNNEPSGALEGFTVKRLASVLRIGNAPLTPRLLRLPKYDLVHLHYPYIFGADFLLLHNLLHRQPYVVTYHNDLSWRGWKGRLFSLYQSMNARIILHRAERIMAVNWDFGQCSKTLSVFMRNSEKVIEVSNGVDTSRFSPELNGDAIRSKYDVNPDITLIGFVGVMDTVHYLKGGVPQLIQALAAIGNPSIRVMFIGGGAMIPLYTALAERMGLGSLVFFTGFVPDEDLPQHYAAMDFVVQPSVLFESFGLAVAEAMACGKPVIASALPGVRTLVVDGVSGRLVRAGDVADLATKIESMAADPATRKRMGLAGRRRVEERYDWHQIGDRLEQVYGEVLVRTRRTVSL